MAFGQIDPARLQSEALKRWYLRSPAEIEEEREQKAASTYDAFFAPATADLASEQSTSNERTPGDHAWSSWQQLDGGPWRGERRSAVVLWSPSFDGRFASGLLGLLESAGLPELPWTHA